MNADSQARWSFWIDVGGTFTDALVRSPDGDTRRLKVLSSGRVPGRGQFRDDRTFVDPARSADPVGFWDGCSLRWGESHRSRVTASAEGRFQLGDGSPEGAGQEVHYELDPGLPAPLLAIHQLLGIPLSQGLPAVDVRLGATRGTNALLTRTGACTGLVTTAGFGDALLIGTQARPRLFARTIRKPPPLHAAALEVAERIAADGEVLTPLDEVAARAGLVELRRQGIESLAICLLNAFANDQHERRLEEIAVEVGFACVRRSTAAARLMKLVPRGQTTVVDAYLTPVLRDYLEEIAAALGSGSRLRVMTSAGGLVDAGSFSGQDSVLSGPAGGVVALSALSRATDRPRVIGFDMGGTSTDVSRYAGELEYQYETEKAGVPLTTPMLAIETVAAGGGSICAFDGVKLVVGPQSAGADPGPACYGRGGPLTVTDANLWLGRVPAARFPLPLDQHATQRRLLELADEVAASTGVRYDLFELAAGLVRIANENMAQAIRSITVAKGFDAREHTLVAFGGAAPQHACAVAELLGIHEALIPADAGVFSGLGMGLAEVTRHAEVGLYQPLAEANAAGIAAAFAALEEEVVAGLADEGVAAARVEIARWLDLRYVGLDAWLTVPEPGDGNWRAAYEARHSDRFGFRHAGKELEVVAARVRGTGPIETMLPPSRIPAEVELLASPGSAGLRDDPAESAAYEQFRSAPILSGEELAPGAAVAGPAILLEPTTTVVVDPGWQCCRLSGGDLLLTQAGPRSTPHALRATASREPDPIQLEVFNNRFAGIAEQMGLTLQATATSVNVKERLDFSCAIFTAAGDLVVNAPHIPVHLGAMGETVKALRAEFPTVAPGDVLLTNDPFRGGSHLPDVTVVTPVFDDAGQEIRFFTASRAHHAEIGGLTPGSMPPGSTTLAEEGVLLPPLKLIDAGQEQFEPLRQRLNEGPYPSRAPEDNLADIAAQVAANRRGAAALSDLIAQSGWPLVSAYMGHIQDAAERKTRAALAKLPRGVRRRVDRLDDGSPIAVEITLSGETAVFDFTGTAGVHPGNLNANRAITTAAALYCLRLLIDEEIPLNQGVLAPVTLRIPPGLLDPRGLEPAAKPASERPASELPAVVGGNVETSQRIVDVLLGALDLAAASQGTMNNCLFGDGSFGYYETICGGAGATADGPGADAVHTHMTNTRLTDPEVLERRRPVRVRRFAIRHGSGGSGLRQGGAGVIRELEFLRPLRLSLLTSRRGPDPPFGLHGGEPGQLGRNTLLRRNKSGGWEHLDLGAQCEVEVFAGDVLRMETPGGGGWGVATEPS